MAGVAVLLLIGIGAITFWPKSGEQPEAVCSLVVDRTGSSLDTRTKESYKDAAERTIDGCRQIKSTFTAFFFDNENAKLQKLSAQQPFRLYRPMEKRKSIGETKLRSQVRQATRAAESAFDKPAGTGRGSDIVSALAQAADDLQTQGNLLGLDRKYLVLLTDGYQSDDLSMRKAFTGPDVSENVLLKQVRKLGLVPNLDGVDVTFVGVNGGVESTKQHLPTWYDATVKRFWVKLVQEGGGSVCGFDVEVSSLPGSC